MRRALAVLMALVALALALVPASAETCTGTATAFSWGPVATTSPASQWTGCTPDGTDSFVIPNGAVVTVIGNAAPPTEDVVITTGGITVNSGGRLIAERGASITTASIDGGNAGLTVADGGALTFEGSCKRGPRNATAVTTNMNDPTCTETHAWFIGDVIPCDGNCATGANKVRIEWTEPKYGTDGGDTTNGWSQTGLDEAVRSITDSQDVACFLNFWPTAKSQAGELLQCYEIIAHSTTSGDGA